MMLKQTTFLVCTLLGVMFFQTSLLSQQLTSIGQNRKHFVQSNTSSQYVVTNTDDSGRGLLQEAINAVQTTAGMDTIRFQIPGTDANYDASAGVAVGMDSTIQNTITQNSITANQDVGILLYDGGNQELSPPTIASFSSSSVTGTAPPNSAVEIFSDPADEGKCYEGTTTANAEGNFQ